MRHTLKNPGIREKRGCWNRPAFINAIICFSKEFGGVRHSARACRGNVFHPTLVHLAQCQDMTGKYLRKLYDENGFPYHFHLHTLRHYVVSTMLHNGLDKQTVTELAGHGDTSFLEQTYCHLQRELKQQASGRLTNTLFYPDRAEKVQEDTSV